MSGIPASLEQLLAKQQAVKEAKAASDREEAATKQPASTASQPLKGGMAASKGVTAAKVDPEQLRMGVEVEQEHTTDEATAQRIALDHLAEIPDYYTRLKEMEAGAKKAPDTSTADTEKTASAKPAHTRNGTMKLSQLSALLQKAAAQETPVQQAKEAKSKKPDLALAEVARRRASKNLITPAFVSKKSVPKKEYAAAKSSFKKSEDQLVQALQQVKVAQALKEAQLSPEQAEILKQVLPDLVTPGAGQTGALKGLGVGAGAGGALGAILGALHQPHLFGPRRGQMAEAGGVGGAVLGAGLGAGIGGIGGVVRGRKKARKSVERASGESEEKPKKKEKEDVSKKESQAFMIGFLTKCAEDGFTVQELEKIAANWQAVLEALKSFGGGARTGAGNIVDTIRSLIQGGAASTPRLSGTAARAGQVTGQIGLPAAALGGAGLGGAALGQAAAPEPPDTLGEKLRALVSQ